MRPQARGRAAFVSGILMTLVNRTRALSDRLERAKAGQVVPKSEMQARILAPTPAPSPVPLRPKLQEAPAKLAADETATNNRRAKRKQTSLPAMIAFQNMRVTVPCMVADMSGTGARLAFTATTLKQFGELDHLPEKFTLVLRVDRMQVECETKWRREGRLGVRFLGPPKPIETTRR